VKRNRAAVWTAGTFAVVLLAATGVSVAFGLMARRAEGIADLRRVESEANEAKARQAEGVADQRREDSERAGLNLQDARDDHWATCTPHAVC
jgi:hypothetical protein